MPVIRLLVLERRFLRACRESIPSSPPATQPHPIGGTDLTKVKLPHVGWAYIVLVLDWHRKKIVGHRIGLRSKTPDWLDALYVACTRQFSRGIPECSGVSLVSGNGCQPPSERYMNECASLGIKHLFKSFNHPTGCAGTPQRMRTMKETQMGLTN
jgi:Integrase core domain.